MSKNTERETSSAKANYQLLIADPIGRQWSAWFYDMEIMPVTDGKGNTLTSLKGSLADQAALYGLIGRIRDLGLTLVALHRIDEEFGTRREMP